MRVVGRMLADFAKVGRSPKEAMIGFRDWLAVVAKAGKPVFVGFNATFDWAFVDFYFHHDLGENPFGIGGIDIKSYYMGLAWLCMGRHQGRAAYPPNSRRLDCVTRTMRWMTRLSRPSSSDGCGRRLAKRTEGRFDTYRRDGFGVGTLHSKTTGRGERARCRDALRVTHVSHDPALLAQHSDVSPPHSACPARFWASSNYLHFPSCRVMPVARNEWLLMAEGRPAALYRRSTVSHTLPGAIGLPGAPAGRPDGWRIQLPATPERHCVVLVPVAEGEDGAAVGAARGGLRDARREEFRG